MCVCVLFFSFFSFHVFSFLLSWRNLNYFFLFLFGSVFLSSPSSPFVFWFYTLIHSPTVTRTTRTYRRRRTRECRTRSTTSITTSPRVWVATPTASYSSPATRSACCRRCLDSVPDRFVVTDSTYHVQWVRAFFLRLGF